MNHLRAAWAARVAAWSPGPLRLPNGMSVSTGGDGVPGGYNGYVVAWAPGGEKAGYVDYQTETGGDDVLIAYIEVDPAFQRQGIASMLIEYMLRYETPNRTLNWGMSTPDGSGLARGYRGPRRIDP